MFDVLPYFSPKDTFDYIILKSDFLIKQDKRTFNLPNLKDKTIRGDLSGASATNIGYSTLGQLPKIYGEIGNYWTTAASGAFYANSGALGSEKNEPHGIANTRFDASRCSSAYARSDNIVIPNSLTMHWVIKY